MKKVFTVFGLAMAALLLVAATGNEYHGHFIDDGSGLTSLPAASITGSGTLPLGVMNAAVLTNHDQRQYIFLGDSIRIQPGSYSGGDEQDDFVSIGGGNSTIGISFTSDQPHMGGFDYDWGAGFDFTYGQQPPDNPSNDNVLAISGEAQAVCLYPDLASHSSIPEAAMTTNGFWADGLKLGIKSVTAAYTNSPWDTTILVKTSSLTITLPSAVDNSQVPNHSAGSISGHIYTIKLITPATSGTVATTASQKIDGATTYSLTASNKFVTVQSDGANWWIIGNN